MNRGTYTNRAFTDDYGQCEKVPDEKPTEQLSKDYEPYAHRQVKHPLTNNETLVHLLKNELATGIFSMPNAFHQAGYVVGFFGTIILGSICTYCVHMLVNTHYLVCKKKQVPCMTYSEVAEVALEMGPERFRRFAPAMRHLVNTFILIYQVGSGSIFVVFVASNFKALLDYFFKIDIDIRLLMLIILLPLILINYIKNLKYLAPFSTFGNVISLISFGIICYYLFREPFTLEGRNATMVKWSDFTAFFGTVLFAMEAIGAMIPLENEMKKPQDFVGTTGVLNRAMTIVVSMFVGMGLLGFLRYGPDTRSTITLNLPEKDVLAQLVKGLIGISVFITHSLVMYVGIEIAWKQYFVSRVENSPYKSLWDYALRTLLVVLTFLFAVAIPNLGLFISLLGALALSMLGLAMPAFLECCARWYSTAGLSRAVLVFKTVFICGIGLAGLIVGTTLSIKDIVDEYSK